MEVYKRDENGDPQQYRATGYFTSEDADYLKAKMDELNMKDAEVLRHIVREHEQYAEEDN